jgi:hypothetical protein
LAKSRLPRAEFCIGGNVQPLAISRLLKKYKYPPEEAEDAKNIVLKQCEQWAENEEQNRIVVLEENTTVSKLSFKQPAPASKILAKRLGNITIYITQVISVPLKLGRIKY